MPIFTLTAEAVDGWFRGASKEAPYPSSAACSLLATRVDLLKTAPGRSDKQKAPRPVVAALEALSARIPAARDYWEAAASRSNDRRMVSKQTAPMALARIALLEDSIDRFPPDWLLDFDVTVNELAWQAHARDIYPDVTAAWESAGRTTPKPHDKSPVCRVVYSALKYVGDPVKSIGSIAKEIRRQMDRGGLQM